MILAKLRCDPDNGGGLQSCSVSNQLAEVTVIGPFNLILNENPGTVVVDISTKNIGSKLANTRFGRLWFESHVKGRAEKSKVFF